MFSLCIFLVEMNDEDDANDSDNDDNDDDDLPQTEQQKGKQDNIDDEDREKQCDKPQAADKEDAEDDQSNKDDVEIEDKNNDLDACDDDEGNVNNDDEEYDDDDDDDSEEGGFDLRLDDMDEEQREHIIRLITAAADGNPEIEGLSTSEILRVIMRQQGLRRGEYDDDDDTDDGPLDYPFGPHLPNSLQEVAEFILSDQCRNILVLAGAGMSVSAGTY